VFTLRYELTKYVPGLISVCKRLSPYRKITAYGVPLYVRTWRATRLHDTCTCLHNSFALCFGSVARLAYTGGGRCPVNLDV